MGDTIPVSSTLTASLQDMSQPPPDPARQSPLRSLDGEQAHDDDESGDPEAILLAIVHRYTELTGTSALARVSQLINLLDAPSTHTGTGDALPRAAGAALPAISLVPANTFSALREGGNIIPHALMTALANDEFLPLACFLSTELVRRNTTNVQYSYKQSAVHARSVIDITEFADLDFGLTRDQFLDAHRNLLRAYRRAFNRDVGEDLERYQERLRSDSRFHKDSDWPAILQFDREIRMAWHNKYDGHFCLAASDTFAQLDQVVLQRHSKTNEELSRALARLNTPGNGQPHRPAARRRSASPPGSASPHHFRESSRTFTRRPCCILCGSNAHSGRACDMPGAKCELRNSRLWVKSSGERICFDYNIPKSCVLSGPQHAPHKCSVCLGAEHSAQKCPTLAGERRH